MTGKAYSAVRNLEQQEVYFKAMRARDHRFDGKFFVGVKTTKIYCRPICPAKPKRENVLFFHSHIEAERAGFRPCLRCRPESAPRSPAWVGKSAVVQRALRVLSHSTILNFNEDQFAAKFGVTSRHLRRLFMSEIGKTPKQICIENRLNLARKLIVETRLPVSEIAFASGFGSVRRFNEGFKNRFNRSPNEIRRNKVLQFENLKITLPYRPPFDYEGLLHFYRNHRPGDLEWFDEKSMERVVEFAGKVGTVSISNDEKESRLVVEIDFPDTARIHNIVSRVRSLFDLDSDPVVIANSLEIDPAMKTLVRKYPGIRMPSGWDPFEVAVAAILGQLVSVERGRGLVADLIELLGKESGLVTPDGAKPIRLFPSPDDVARADLTSLKSTRARKQTLQRFAGAVAKGEISLEPTQDVEEFIRKLLAIKGIGPWTASYMAMKVLRHTDAFPATDLILARALELHPTEVIQKMSPWRGYAASLLWREYAMKLKKTRRNHAASN